MDDWSSLHSCPTCGSELVQPTAFEDTKCTGLTRVCRWCPECDWTADDLMTHSEVVTYELEIEARRNGLERALRRLDAERRCEEGRYMERIAEVFGPALEQNLITADDFLIAPHRRAQRGSKSRYSRHG